MEDTANSVPVEIVDRSAQQDFDIDLSLYPKSVVFARNRRLREEHWRTAFDSQNIGHHQPLNFLEVGCQEGSSTLWFLENYFGHPDTRVTVIDPFGGSMLDNFTHNMKVSGHDQKVDVRQGKSGEVLRDIPLYSMDAIYIDGLHSSFAVIEDTILCWRLLKNGGLLMFDDYKMRGRTHYMDKPAPAIDFFMEAFDGKYELIAADALVSIRKTYPDSQYDTYLSAPVAT
ncbi:MAG: hypothetical protein GKS03_02275 [Alphaproteobacteria bacterium]|nr:hypothetical protein [Alphaproteobacteria bacterium]